MDSRGDYCSGAESNDEGRRLIPAKRKRPPTSATKHASGEYAEACTCRALLHQVHRHLSDCSLHLYSFTAEIRSGHDRLGSDNYGGLRDSNLDSGSDDDGCSIAISITNAITRDLTKHSILVLNSKRAYCKAALTIIIKQLFN
jgi:hypothetical protein